MNVFENRMFIMLFYHCLADNLNTLFIQFVIHGQSDQTVGIAVAVGQRSAVVLVLIIRTAMQT